jgi:hypothetical protein
MSLSLPQKEYDAVTKFLGGLVKSKIERRREKYNQAMDTFAYPDALQKVLDHMYDRADKVKKSSSFMANLSDSEKKLVLSDTDDIWLKYTEPIIQKTFESITNSSLSATTKSTSSKPSSSVKETSSKSTSSKPSSSVKETSSKSTSSKPSSSANETSSKSTSSKPSSSSAKETTSKSTSSKPSSSSAKETSSKSTSSKPSSSSKVPSKK